MINFRANIIKNSYLKAGIKKAKEYATNGNIHEANNFCTALCDIENDTRYGEFKIDTVKGIVTGQAQVKPYVITEDGREVIKERYGHPETSHDDGAQCVAAIIDYGQRYSVHQYVNKDYMHYCALQKQIDKSKNKAAEDINNRLDSIV